MQPNVSREHRAMRFARLVALLVCAVAAGAALSSSGRAQDGNQDGDHDRPEPPRAGPGPGGGHPHEPPQVAFDACVDEDEGDPCQVTFRQHTINGVCEANAKEKLFCRPLAPPPRAAGDQPPPPNDR